jgi:hypothetical protein
LRTLFLFADFQLLCCPFFDFLLDFFDNDCCLLFGILLLDLFKDFEPFVTFLSVEVEEEAFVVALKRVDFLLFEKIGQMSLIITLEGNMQFSLLKFVLNKLLPFFEDAQDTLI